MLSQRFNSHPKAVQDFAPLRLICVVVLLFLIARCDRAQAQEYRLKAPATWGGETIKLPPGFANNMLLKGVEHIRFAPGMMDSQSDTFFCYAFVFEVETKPELTEELIKTEFLKYYRGLSKAVLNGKPPAISFDKFQFELSSVATESEEVQMFAKDARDYIGKLDWIEPFATKKPQRLNVEIRKWKANGKSYLFACVSPQKADAEIWDQLHVIRDAYAKSLSRTLPESK